MFSSSSIFLTRLLKTIISSSINLVLQIVLNSFKEVDLMFSLFFLYLTINLSKKVRLYVTSSFLTNLVIVSIEHPEISFLLFSTAIIKKWLYVSLNELLRLLPWEFKCSKKSLESFEMLSNNDSGISEDDWNTHTFHEMTREF